MAYDGKVKYRKGDFEVVNVDAVVFTTITDVDYDLE